MLRQGCPIVMGSMTAGSVRCYAAMLVAGRVYIDPEECRLPLRHSHHRYLIEGPNGVQKLTIALAKESNAMLVPMKDVRISEHGNWRHLHWGALYSAYGKSPYFDYVADDLKAVLDGSQSLLLDFNTQLQQLIISFMDLPIEVNTTSITSEIMKSCIDLRGRMGGKRPDSLVIANTPYYQLWATRHGFQPNLSILDLLMNCGREGIYTLLDMADGLRS